MTNQELIIDFLVKHHYKALTPRAALFDMDGTLYDSMPNHAKAWHRMATDAGIESTEEEFFLYEGSTGAATINLLMNRAFHRDATDEEKEKLYHLKSKYFQEMPPVKPMPAAMDLLDFIVKTGMQRVLVTGSGQRSLIDRLQHDFPGVFTADKMVTSHNVTHGKPHPEPYIKAMQMARVSPSAAIVFENAPLGVKSAAAAGVFTVGLTTGPIPRAELEKAGASIVYNSMEECAELFPQLVLDIFTTTLP